MSLPLFRSRLTAIFAKLPRAGRVKTRLCPPLDFQEAALLHQAMLEDLLERCSSEPSWSTCLVLGSEPGEEQEARAWYEAHAPKNVEFDLQRGSGLGERMAQFFEERLSATTDRPRSLVLVGSDAPLVTRAQLAHMHAGLEAGADVALLPDAGGGYCAIGLRAVCRALFLDVRMSSSDMYSATLGIARARALRVLELPVELDVDTEQDLARLAHRLEELGPQVRGSPDHPRRTAELLADLRSARGPLCLRSAGLKS